MSSMFAVCTADMRLRYISLFCTAVDSYDARTLASRLVFKDCNTFWKALMWPSKDDDVILQHQEWPCARRGLRLQGRKTC